jgi:hypothetical protein
MMLHFNQSCKIAVRLIGAVLLPALVLLCSCQPGGQVRSVSGETAYVPAKNWNGLETTDYAGFLGKDLALGEEGYVATYPNGSPSPDVYEKAPSDAMTYPLEWFTVSTDKKQYSISELENIRVHVQVDGDQSPQGTSCLNRIVNLERLDGNDWVRMIVYPPIKFQAVSNWFHIGHRSEVELELHLDHVATKLYPGKYRIIVYVNPDCAPLYAEIDLVR